MPSKSKRFPTAVHSVSYHAAKAVNGVPGVKSLFPKSGVIGEEKEVSPLDVATLSQASYLS